MLFNSLDFTIFLAILLPLFYAANSRWKLQNVILIAAGYIFYGWWDARFLGLLILSTIADYTAGRVMGTSSNERVRKLAFILVLAFNLGLLGTFKYFNFFAESFAALTRQTCGWEPGWTSINIVLPVGISFYTFQSIGYSIDVYRRQIPATTDYISYSAFVAFFPQLVAGPIERAGHLLKQMAGPRTQTAEGIWLGLIEFIWGLFKKLVIADYLAPHVDAVFANLDEHPPKAILMATFVFAFQVYGDFSAYTDMARGLARMMGFDLIRNFNTPYLATSIQDFWHRWHMSLSGWFRDYLYLPLGGSRKGEVRTYANILAVFLVSGLWHGANWTYVIWGGMHGLGLCAQRLLTKFAITSLPRSERVASILGGLVTFAFVCAGWYLFRAPNIDAATRGLVWIFETSEMPTHAHKFQECTSRIAILFLLEWMTRKTGLPEWITARRASIQVSLVVLMLVACAMFNPKETGSFIYFQF